FAERDYFIRPREYLSQGTMAIVGRLRGAQRHAPLRAHYRLHVRDNSTSMAARQPRSASSALGPPWCPRAFHRPVPCSITVTVPGAGPPIENVNGTAVTLPLMVGAKVTATV